MKVVSDDENVILVSKNEKQTTTVCIVMEEELSADPVARLIALDEYHQHEESEIEVFETRGNGKAYRLRDISGDSVRDQYVVQEGDREFTVDVMLDLKLLEKYDDILRELVLSMALVQ